MKTNKLFLSSLMAGLSFGGLPMHSIPSLPRQSFVPGDAIGRGAKPGEIFDDGNGRKYVKDEKGTIRRA